MVKSAYHPHFQKQFKKIKDNAFKERLIKQFLKIYESPEIGKPMMHNRKGTREVYVNPYRLSYIYIKEEDKIVFLDLYHKDEQ